MPLSIAANDIPDEFSLDGLGIFPGPETSVPAAVGFAKPADPFVAVPNVAKESDVGIPPSSLSFDWAVDWAVATSNVSGKFRARNASQALERTP